MVRVSEFDPSACLDDDEVVAEYLTTALEDDNPDVFLAAVGHVAKVRGMSAIAERAGPTPGPTSQPAPCAAARPDPC